MDYEEAVALYERDEFAAAARALERFLDESPGHVDAIYKLANARRELGDLRAAAAHYRALLALDASHAMALNNLGAVEQMLGRPAQAELCYRKALEIEPRLAQPYGNLGRLMQSQGRHAEAAALYRKALAMGLDEGYFGHLLHAAGGAAGGAAVAKAPAAYVRETFDAFAPQFDRHLVEALDYRVPERLAAMVRDILPDGGMDILDLGCGTGLAGEAFSPLARALVGVDLSSGMLERARQRGCYEALHAADIGDWLAGAPAASFDVAVAADVFIYIGDLAAVFAGAARVLRASGVFAFSVESGEAGDWQLLPSGRYAQSSAYLARLADEHGFARIRGESTQVRLGVSGELHLLRKK